MARYDQITEIEEIEDVQKYNHNHDSLGRFSSANGAASHDAYWHEHHASEDVGDAARQLSDPKRYNIGGKKNSLDGHIGADGKLTPERDKLHRKIIDKNLEGKVPVQGQATMTLLGGGPASGKSSVMSTHTENDPHSVTVDPDHFKKELPGFDELSTQTTQAADFYHEESSSLSKRYAETALNENLNVIYDGTGDGKNTRSMEKKIQQARDKGYRVEAKYVSVDTEEGVRRNNARYENALADYEAGKSKTPPRRVPDDYVRSIHARATDVSVALAHKYDHIEVWDNNGKKGSTKKIAEGGNGKYLKPVKGQEEAFKKYLAKSKHYPDGFEFLPDGSVRYVGPWD